jgi:4'-phosphopantetheinyl transferase EntD
VQHASESISRFLSETCQSAIAAILPDCVSVAESFGGHDGALLPEEEVLVRSALPMRRAEFAAGRTCARQALAALGIASQPILCGFDREPVWPDKTVGSITHCDGYCAAAVARNKDIGSLGIDAEPNRSLPEGLIDVIASASECENAARFSRGIPNWDRLLFSAKESVYKAWYPLRKVWLDFEDISIVLMPATSSFDVSFTSSEMDWFKHRRSTFSGRYMLTKSHILTSALVSAVIEV